MIVRNNAGKEKRLYSLIDECKAHRKRLEQAKEKCAPFFPLTSIAYSELKDDQVEHIDQMVYRFTKLQDALGAKLFPAVISQLKSDADALPFIDVLNSLEKAGAIPEAKEWITLREIRNQLVHDYGDDPEAGSTNLNMVFDKVESLVTVWETTRAFVVEKILPSLNNYE